MLENEFIKKELLKVILDKNRVPRKILYCRNGSNQKVCLTLIEASRFLELSVLTIKTYLSRNITSTSGKIFRFIDSQGYLKLIIKEYNDKC